jgi:hypothetical protein
VAVVKTTGTPFGSPTQRVPCGPVSWFAAAKPRGRSGQTYPCLGTVDTTASNPAPPTLMRTSTPSILHKSRVRRRACTDLCGGRSVVVVPTASGTRKAEGFPSFQCPMSALVIRVRGLSPGGFQAQLNPLRCSGRVRILLPVAAKMALLTAGKVGGSVGSPRPVGA